MRREKNEIISISVSYYFINIKGDIIIFPLCPPAIFTGNIAADEELLPARVKH